MGAQAAAALLAGDRIGRVPAPTAAVTTLPLGPVPAGLRLERVARSHGWSGLAPCGWDAPAGRLHRVLSLRDAGGTDEVATPVWVEADWAAHSGRALTEAQADVARRQLRWCLGLDDDVSGAPASVRSTRMLRSPTVFEDLAKTLLTTNCSWAATVGMVARLVDSCGVDGAFPRPDAVARAGERGLRDEVRVGYRAAALVALAEWAASGGGRVEMASWLDPRTPDEAVVAAVRRLRGFGRYAAEGMLGLLGRPRGLAVDSWIRARLGGLTARQVEDAYATHGRWAGAVLWQDVTADWFAR